MIQKLRVKFIIASMLSLALVLLVILGGVNAMSYQKIVRDADHILEPVSYTHLLGIIMSKTKAS